MLRFVVLAALLTLVSCRSGGVTPVATAGAGPTPQPGASPTSFQPPSPSAEPSATATAVPLALIVNGAAITLDEYNLAMQRFHAGIPEAPSAEARERVLADFIDQILLAQAAAAEGFTMSEDEFQARLAGLAVDAGGEEALNAWLAANFYPRAVFESDLRRSAAAAWMRDRLFDATPRSAEQVRARQIRLTTRAEADSVLQQLAGGTSFDLLAGLYDPEGLGELGWFPRGLLFEPAIEEAAFALSVGDYAGVIETPVGFHIIQVTDYAADRPLDPDALWALQLQALEDWLAARRAESAIEVLVP